MEAKITRVNAELIFSFFFSAFGKYLIKLMLKPKRLKLLSNDTAEIRAVAIPTLPVGNTLATNIQKAKPSTPIIAELDMR